MCNVCGCFSCVCLRPPVLREDQMPIIDLTPEPPPRHERRVLGASRHDARIRISRDYGWWPDDRYFDRCDELGIGY